MPEIVMDFAPLNDDHAIEEIRFAYIIDREITKSDLDALKSRHRDVKPELPAIILLGEESAPSIEFAHVRPDATSTWSLEFKDDLISVICTRYTRWEKVWSNAERFLNFGLSILSETQNCEVVALAMMVTDKFKTSKMDYNLQTLLQGSQILPTDIFERKFVWHTHNGWVELMEDGMVVHTLRVDCRMDEPEDERAEELETGFAVVMQHAQRFQPQKPVAVEGQVASTLSSVMAKMHMSNKAIMTALLTKGMSDRIGLSMGA